MRTITINIDDENNEIIIKSNDKLSQFDIAQICDQLAESVFCSMADIENLLGIINDTKENE